MGVAVEDAPFEARKVLTNLDRSHKEGSGSSLLYDHDNQGQFQDDATSKRLRLKA